VVPLPAKQQRRFIPDAAACACDDDVHSEQMYIRVGLIRP
jgi:hypothetical protein